MRWHECTDRVRFCEVDAFDFVWHGHYIKYFEIGRMGLARKFSLTPEHMKGYGYVAPVVDLGCRFKVPARFGDEIRIRTTVEPSDKASLTFRYELLRTSDESVLSDGFTTHVLLTLKGTMMYVVPDELRGPLEEMLAYCND